MARYFARIVRALIVSLLGFGGGVGLMVFIAALVIKGDQNAFQYGLKAGTLMGGIFAVMLVGVLLPLDLTAHLFLAKGRYREIWELEQMRELTFQGSLRDATAYARKSLLLVPYVKAVIEDPEHLLIRASIGTSWRSSGEQMEVEINPVAEDAWHLKCTSKSKYGHIVFDYGKNFENVETWLKAMNRHSGSQEQAA